MDKSLTYLYYRPPKSNCFGHYVRSKNIQHTAKDIIQVVKELFNATSSNELDVILYYNGFDKDETIKIKKSVTEINLWTGKDAEHWPSPMQPIPSTYHWKLKEYNILQFLEKMASDTNLPLSYFQIIETYNYGSGEEPKGFFMMMSERGKLHIGISAIIPFPTNNIDCFKFIEKLQNELPFKLNSNHFRRIGQSKRGYGYWKLDDDTKVLVEKSLKNGLNNKRNN
ncbi:MAG: hypothetical protein U0U66_14125 [Cytophagaceae bacterium]